MTVLFLILFLCTYVIYIMLYYTETTITTCLFPNARNCYSRILNHYNGDTDKANETVNNLYHDIELQSDGKN